MNITREELDDLYNRQRLSVGKIAQLLNVSETTVYKWMDYFALPRRSLSEAHLPLLDDDEIVRLYANERLTLGQIAQRLDVDRHTVSQRLEASGVPRRNKGEAAVVFPRRDFSGDPIEKAYLIGFRLGDLRVKMGTDGPDCTTIQVGTRTSRIEQVNLIHGLFSPYGRVCIALPDKNGAYSVECQLNKSFGFLLPKQDSIPAWILASALDGNVPPFLAFLGGYIDAEGCFRVPRDGRARFSLESYDVNILRYAQTVLAERLNVQCPPVRLHHPKGIPICGGKYATNNDCWCLGVYRRASLCRLCELLEPYLKHAKRRADMYAVWANVTARGV